MLSRTATMTNGPSISGQESLEYYKRTSFQDKKNAFHQHKMLGSSLDKNRSARASSKTSKPPILANSTSSKVISNRGSNLTQRQCALLNGQLTTDYVEKRCSSTTQITSPKVIFNQLGQNKNQPLDQQNSIQYSSQLLKPHSSSK